MTYVSFLENRLNSSKILNQILVRCLRPELVVDRRGQKIDSLLFVENLQINIISNWPVPKIILIR